MRNLIITTKDVVAGSNNSTYRFSPFTSNIQFPAGSKVALDSLSAYYSNYNITSAFNNNTFQIIWIDNNILNIVIPNSFMTIQALNNFLQSKMLEAGYYLIDGAGNYYFYANIQINSTFYKCQLNTIALPATLPAGWTLGSGSQPAWGLGGTAKAPQFRILNNNFTKIIGFNAGDYPAVQGTTTQSFLSSFTPEVSPVNIVSIRCNLINSTYAIANNILYSYTFPVGFGESYTQRTTEHVFYDIAGTSFPYVEIQFVNGETFEPLDNQDPVLNLSLIIKGPNE